MAKVTEVKVTGGTSNLGTFRTKLFNVFHEDQLAEYELLRGKAMDASSGVKIDHIQQLARKTTIVDREGDHERTETTEDLFLMVQWWEKRVERDKGDSNAELNRATKDWSIERSAANE